MNGDLIQIIIVMIIYLAVLVYIGYIIPTRPCKHRQLLYRRQDPGALDYSHERRGFRYERLAFNGSAGACILVRLK